MEKQVAKFRIYCIDGSHKVAAAHWIEAVDDDDAIRIMKAQHSGFKCELWDGHRLVARLDLREEA